MMRMNFQDALKETLEQIKIHLKDKQIEAILSLLRPLQLNLLFLG